MIGWLSDQEVFDLWADAPDDETRLHLLNVTAISQLEAFAPATTTVIPEPWKLAQLQQVQNLWNAANVGSDGGIGDGDFVIRPRPLDWHVRSIIRPKRAVPWVG